MGRRLKTMILWLVLAVAVTRGEEEPPKLNSSQLFPRSIQNFPRDRGGGGFLGSPVEWTMSKANLVAEFYTSEPGVGGGSRVDRSSFGSERSPKSIFSLFGGSGGKNGTHNVKRSNNEKGSMLRPPPPSPQQLQQGNLLASGTSYNGQAALPHPDSNRINGNNGNGNGFRFPPAGGGYSTPFRPIVKFPQQGNYLIQGSPDSGYPKNLRPPRGPPQPQQLYGLPPPPSMNRQINGLRPPPGPSPSALYLPPRGNQPQQQQQQQNPSQSAPPPPPPPNHVLTLPNQEPRQPSQSFQQGQSQYPPPPPSNSSTIMPSQQYSPQRRPEQSQGQPQFRPGPPPPQILDNYRNQAVYPVPAPPVQTDDKQTVYVLANGSNSMGSPPSPPPKSSYNSQQSDSFTNYENESIPPNPHPNPPPQQQPPTQYLPPSPPQNPSLNELSSTNPLSQVLLDANLKAGPAMDKTIRFVIHKPEDEDIVKNAILEDAQNRYEDVRFVQGPTLKVQRKETVYLPPKRKTVVYILLKEPQIDTDVQVMSPQEEEPAPEVYITYQKSDGAVKTKHYSPKPIRQEDMKKYLDIEEDSGYGAAEESRLHPRFSKSTSVSLSTSSKVSRTTASTSRSTSLASTEVMDSSPSSSLLSNHKMPLNESEQVAPFESLPVLKASPLLYSSFTSASISSDSSSVRDNRSSSSNSSTNNKNYLINYRAKKGRSSSPSTSASARGRQDFIPPSPRRVLRNPARCATIE